MFKDFSPGTHVVHTWQEQHEGLRFASYASCAALRDSGSQTAHLFFQISAMEK